MGIDRIGKKAPPPPPPNEAVGSSRTAGVAGAFRVETPPPANPVGRVDASGALELLRAGKVDLGGYLDLKVDEATAHLQGLPRVELDAIRRAVRDRLASDPTLVELVRTATGQIPQLSGDD